MDIKWQEGAVCYADGKQWFAYDGYILNSERGEILPRDGLASAKDFQLNTIKQGDYISKSELDTEDKYNRAVDEFGLFGFEFNNVDKEGCRDFYHNESLTCCDDGLWKTSDDMCNERKITFNQLMAIGELKRLMNEREKSAPKIAPDLTPDVERNQPKNKSKQAYAILESLDYEYDLVKQQWFRKEWV